MSEKYGEDQPWHLTQEPNAEPSYEELIDHIEELQAQRNFAHKQLVMAEGKLQDQTTLIEQLFALLDITEETDDGRVFHPNTIRSCRALDAEKLEQVLGKLKNTLER